MIRVSQQWTPPTPDQIFTLKEIRKVVEYLHGTTKRTRTGRDGTVNNAWLNLMIFRLSCCCGMRCCEIRQVALKDFLLSGPRPVIKIRKECTKGELHRRRARTIPLWWDKGTFDDINYWITSCREAGIPEDTPAVYNHWHGRQAGKTMYRRRVIERWDRFTTHALGKDRADQLHMHSGRHSFGTYALANGRNLTEVRDAMGHANITTTNVYLHLLESARELPDIFGSNEDE